MSQNTMKAEAENKEPSITSEAWAIYQAAEAKAGRRFTAADRKGKNSEWAKAMRKAYDDVTRERRIAAVQHLLKPVPKYNYYSQDYTERSEGRRRQHNEAVGHNMRILAEASERPLNQKQAAEAQASGLSVKEYREAKEWADENGMSVKEWCLHLEAEEAEAEEKKRVDMEQSHLAWLTEQNNKKVATMRSGYARRRY